jgi:ketosteroid isomerase-like protein
VRFITERTWLQRTALGAAAWFALLVIGSSGGAAATADFRVLVQTHLDLVNSGDVEGVMATFSEDAVLAAAGLCLETPCVGKTAIQEEIARRAGVGVQHKIISLQESSGSGNGRLELRAGLFSACGVERVVATIEVRTEEGLISYYSSSFDPADQQTQAFLACMASGGSQGGQQQAVRPPSTGSGGLKPAAQ